MNNIISNTGFFDNVSLFYDNLIDFEKALIKRKSALEKFATGNVTHAADLGCGTGIDSISLSMHGINVTAFDASAGMIEQAESNARSYDQDINFTTSPIEEIPSAYYGKFQLVISLGNTFANLNNGQFSSAFNVIYNLLMPGGKFVIQTVNFNKLINDDERILNITGRNDYYFIRFYDYLDSHINFNILRFSQTDPGNRNLLTTKLYNHTQEHFKTEIEKAGLLNAQFYSGLDLSEFNTTKSKDLVITGIK